MKKTPILTLALGVGLVAALAGCTSTDTTADSTSAPTPTASLPTPADPVVNKCVDGVAVLTPTAKKPKIELAGSCDVVSVVGTKGTITLGAVKHLVFEGSDNQVTVASVEKVDFGGNDNALTHGGAAPTVTTGTTAGNTVTAR